MDVFSGPIQLRKFPIHIRTMLSTQEDVQPAFMEIKFAVKTKNDNFKSRVGRQSQTTKW